MLVRDTNNCEPDQTIVGVKLSNTHSYNSSISSESSEGDGDGIQRPQLDSGISGHCCVRSVTETIRMSIRGPLKTAVRASRQYEIKSQSFSDTKANLPVGFRPELHRLHNRRMTSEHYHWTGLFQKRMCDRISRRILHMSLTLLQRNRKSKTTIQKCKAVRVECAVDTRWPGSRHSSAPIKVAVSVPCVPLNRLAYARGRASKPWHLAQEHTCLILLLCNDN